MRLLARGRSKAPAGPVQPLSLWHSFKKCISKKAHSVRRSIRWTGHVAYGVKEPEEAAQHAEPRQPIHL